MSSPELSLGCVVEIHGLVSAAHHNGSQGKLVRFDTEKGRWGVKLDTTEEVLGVKPENLKFVKEAEFDHEEEEQKLMRAKRRFDQIRKKYGLDAEGKSGEIADLLTGKAGGSAITADEFAGRYGMKADEALDFLLFIKMATDYKEKYLELRKTL